MPLKDPHHRAHCAMEMADDSSIVNKDPMVHELLAVIKGKSKDADLCYAWDKFIDDTRAILDSFLLAETPHSDIQKVTRVPLQVIRKYATYIFDISVFRDLLECISYVRNCRMYYPPRDIAFLEAAINKGSDYLAWLVCGQYSLTSKDVLAHTMNESHYVSLSHRGSPLVSDNAKQARGWLETSMKAATQLHKLDPQDDERAFTELKITLSPTNNIIDVRDKHAPKPEDILH